MTDFSPLNFPLPERTGAEGLDARVTALEETIVRLLEALQYTLTNLGRENFNPAALERRAPSCAAGRPRTSKEAGNASTHISPRHARDAARTDRLSRLRPPAGLPGGRHLRDDERLGGPTRRCFPRGRAAR